MELIGNFTNGHFKTAIDVRNKLLPNQCDDDKNVNEITIQLKYTFFTNTFIDEIKNKINKNSLDSLKTKIRVIESTKVLSPVRSFFKFDSIEFLHIVIFFFSF